MGILKHVAREGIPLLELLINDEIHKVDTPGDTPLLWVLRETLGLTGTKFGCGIAQCGACTVHIDGDPVRSCSFPVSLAVGKRITTIEGLDGGGRHPLQVAWDAEQVVQCGYCQPGQIMQAAALLARNPQPSEKEIVRYMDGNICRCGTYPRIKRAIQRAAESMR